MDSILSPTLCFDILYHDYHFADFCCELFFRNLIFVCMHHDSALVLRF
jgi:hypothetical protein